MTQTIPDLLQQYQAQQISRAEYWQALKEHHALLHHYSALIRNELRAIHIQTDQTTIELTNGLHFLWQANELRTAPMLVVNDGEYEPLETRLLTYLAAQYSIIADIGANVGWYSLHLAAQVQANHGRIYAFEPVPTTRRILEQNIALNPDLAGFIQAESTALGEAEGIIQLYLPHSVGSVAASHQRLFDNDSYTEISVPIITLDQYAQTHQIAFNLLKIDVEGAERLVLRGATQLIAEQRPVIFLEMLRKWTRRFEYHPNDIIADLAAFGYVCWYDDGEKFLVLDSMDDTCPYTNFLFLHSEAHSDPNTWVFSHK